MSHVRYFRERATPFANYMDNIQLLGVFVTFLGFYIGGVVDEFSGKNPLPVFDELFDGVISQEEVVFSAFVLLLLSSMVRMWTDVVNPPKKRYYRGGYHALMDLDDISMGGSAKYD